ncbi:MAG: hypothetical protein ACRDNW_02455 [Trebonia sp.]
MNEDILVLWTWRAVPKYSRDEKFGSGVEQTHGQAQKQARMALQQDSSLIAAVIVCIAQVNGTWVRARKPEYGVRTIDGRIFWIMPGGVEN